MTTLSVRKSRFPGADRWFVFRAFHLQLAVLLLLGAIGNPQNKVHDDGQQENNGQNRRAEPVIETGLSSHPDRLGSPVVGNQGVDHGQHGDTGEEKGRDEGGAVAKVEHPNRQRAQDNSKVQPGQKGTLVGEEDLGLDSRGKGNALA